MGWYYLLEGKPIGPISTTDIIKEIAVGRMGPKDQLFKDQDTKWRDAGSFAELKNYFKNEQAEDNWVLLLKRAGVKGFKQKGPYSASQIMAKLKAGEINYDDHVWRKGLKEWYKLSTLQEFQKKEGEGAAPLPPLPDDRNVPLEIFEQTSNLKMPQEIKTEEEKIEPEGQGKNEIEQGTENSLKISHSDIELEPDTLGDANEMGHGELDINDFTISESEPIGLGVSKNQKENHSSHVSVIDFEKAKAKSNLQGNPPPLSELKNKPKVDKDISENKPSLSSVESTKKGSTESQTDFFVPSDSTTGITLHIRRDLEKKQMSHPESSELTPEKESKNIIPEEIGKKDSDVTVKKHLKRSKAHVNTVHFIKRVSYLNHFLSLSSVRKTQVIIGFLVLFGCAIGGVLFFSSYKDRKMVRLKPSNKMVQIRSQSEKGEEAPSSDQSVNQREEPVRIDSGVTSENKVGPDQVARTKKDSSPIIAKEKPALKQVNRPTYIRAEVLSSGTSNTSIKIITDGTEQFPINIFITAEGVKVLDKKSIYRVYRIRKEQDREMSLMRLGLPLGEYEVTVESMGFKSAVTAEYGTRTPGYAQNMAKQRKRAINQHNSERLAFIKMASRYQTQATNFVQGLDRADQLKSFNSFYKKWRSSFDVISNKKLSGYNSRTRIQYLHGSQWAKLKAWQSEFQSESKKIKSQNPEKAPVDSAKVREMVAEIGQIREEMIQTSLWK